jgi:hypothetical protein
MEGGIADITHPQNLEQFYIIRRKILAKYVDGNLKIIFENFLKSITC